ncbi:MAG: hypothetical protein ACI4DU_08045 [Lachnospiraceae bacterium]
MKKLNVVFLTIFIILLLLPALSIPVFYSAENTENRELASFPALRTEEGNWNTEYTDQINDWVMDHIGFRQLLVQVNSALRSKVFGQSSEESIILGKDGWLFYSDTAKDYMNLATISERNVNNVAHSLVMVQDYVHAHGSEFVVAFIPNKNSLYGDHMPFYYITQQADGNLELLQQAMARDGVVYADVQAAFRAQDDVLYQATDSHWNYKGALLGYNTILDAAGWEHNRFENLTFTPVQDWDSDLARMLYSTGAEPELQLYPDMTFHYTYTSHEQQVDSIRLTTYNENGNGNVVVYRDSFTNTMQVYLAENFENAMFSRALPYALHYVEEQEADLTILELVERNLIQLSRKAPMMAAPEVSLNANAQGVGSQGFSMYSRETNGYLHLFGQVPEKFLGDSYRVYLLCDVTNSDGNSQMHSFEAFPIYEQELIAARDANKETDTGDSTEETTEEDADNGFSIYLNAEEFSGVSSYYLVICSEDNYYASDAMTPIIDE